MKSALDGLISRLDTVKEKSLSLKTGQKEFSQTEIQRERGKKEKKREPKKKAKRHGINEIPERTKRRKSIRNM